MKLNLNLYEEMVCKRALEFRRKYEEYKIRTCKDPKEEVERQWELSQIEILLSAFEEKSDQEVKEMLEKYETM